MSSLEDKLNAALAPFIGNPISPITNKQIGSVIATLLAEDIAGVQPMTGPTGQVFSMSARYLWDKFRKIDAAVSDGWVIVELDQDVAYWVQANYPLSDWSFDGEFYTVTEEVYTWMVLRWG